MAPRFKKGRKAVNKKDILDAIGLLEISQTAQNDTRAQNAVRILRELWRRNEIGFDTSLGATYASWRGNIKGYDLQVNPNRLDLLPAASRLGALSISLMHEGIHAWAEQTRRPASLRLADELAARVVAIQYYRELLGPGVRARPGVIIRITPIAEYEGQSEAIKRDQLIDLVLSTDRYAAEDYLNADWIFASLDKWGGLRNRSPRTRGLYIRALAQTYNRDLCAAILDIMESVDQRRSDWDAMMKAAGPPRTIQVVMDYLHSWSELKVRIDALERRWGVQLREEPPVPSR
jgi:hypothetical protein